MAAGRLSKLFAQLADEDVDDLELGLVHPPVKVIEEHLLCQGRALAQAQQFEDSVFLAGQVDRLIVDRDDAGVEVHHQLAGPDRRL